MDTIQKKPQQVLNEARAAFDIKNYPLALEHYEWLFDHSLDDPDSGFYGVRLSYCLSQWAELGKVFEPARASMEQRYAQTVLELDQTRERQKFHDLVGFARYIDAAPEPLSLFLQYHQTDRAFASTIYNYICDQLADAGEWKVCSEHTSDADAAYRHLLLMFDQGATISLKNAPDSQDDFVEWNKSHYFKKASNLVMVLTHAHRLEEAQRICERANQDMLERGLSEFLSVYPEDMEE